jgi:hypothetical protein
MDDAGHFVIAWDNAGPVGTQGVYAQRFDPGTAPTLAALADFPDPVTAGNSTTLTASGGFDVDDEVFTVSFYRESNDAPGLQLGSAGDTLIGSVVQNPGGFAIAASTAGLPPGTYTYYAQPHDIDNHLGPPASTTNTVVIGAAPAVTASQFRFDTLPQRLTFAFNQNVGPSLGLDDIVVQQLPGGPTVTPSAVSFDPATNTATFSFTTAIPDGRYRATLLASGVSGPGGNLPADHTFEFTFLRGDADGDGRVNLNDFNILAANFGQSPRDFTQGDFNYDTIVNLNDFNLLASRFGVTLAPAAVDGFNGFDGFGGFDDEDDDDENRPRD